MRNEDIREGGSAPRERGGLDGGQLVRFETRVDRDAFEKLRVLAETNRRSLTAEARVAIERYVEEAA